MYTETLWHTVADAFTCKYFDTAKLILRTFSLYIEACSVTTWTLLITHAFTQRYFDIKTALHRHAFPWGCFHTQKCIFTHKYFYRGDAFTLKYTEQFYAQMPKQTEVLLQMNAFARGAFTYGHFYTDILLREFRWQTRVWRKRIQQAYAKSQFHHSFWQSRRILLEGVGPAQTRIVIWPQCMRLDISCEKVACRGHRSTLPGKSHVCRSLRNWSPPASLLYICHSTPAYVHLSVFQKSISACIYIFRNTSAHIRLVAVLKKTLCEPACMQLHLNTRQ